MTKISVENMGPIVSGEIDLKPLTIFIGPSNTGKSYMATAIYALMKAFEGLASVRGMTLRSRYRRLARRRTPSRLRSFSPDESGDGIEAFRIWIGQEGFNEQDLTVSDLPKAIRIELDRSTLRLLDGTRNDVVDQLHQVYGDASGFVSRRMAPEDFRLAVQRDEPLFNMEIRLSDELRPMPSFDVSLAAVPLIDTDLWQLDSRSENDALIDLYVDLIYNLEISVFDSLFGGLPVRSFYMPAARSGIAQGHKVLAAALVRQSSRIGLQPFNIPNLPSITTEFLSNLISLDPRMGSQGSHEELRKSTGFIERVVLHGRIDLDQSAGLPYPEIVYEPTGSGEQTGTFTLDHTSSMVSELAPVTLFLKYLVEPGDLLILEEPEAHLHPAAQRQMARGIVRLVNAGVMVLITTHSDFLLGAINNLLRLSFAGEDKLAELGFENPDCLSHDNVSAYRFVVDEAAGGSFVHELEIRRDVGINDDEFGRVVNELYDETIAVEQIPIK